MRHPIEFLFPPELGSELIYSFVIVICSLMIYYSTREMYELSSHKGIKYFRTAFLFFAIAYFFRYSIMFLLFLFDLNHLIIISPKTIITISMFIFLYSSIMVVFYLLYSVMWKKWTTNKSKLYLFNIIAIIISTLGILFRGPEISLLINLSLFVFVTIILLIMYKDLKNRHKENNLLFIYFLLSGFFFLNVIDVLIPQFLQIYQLGIYLVSILLFMTILYRVLKKVG